MIKLANGSKIETIESSGVRSVPKEVYMGVWKNELKRGGIINLLYSQLLLLLNDMDDINTLMIQKSIDGTYWLKVDDLTIKDYNNYKGLPIKFNEHGYNECPICKFSVDTDDYYCRNCGQKIYLELEE